jgi:hypothetical protein
MHVPPGHAKNWSKHCSRYNACAYPVYFVKVEDDDHGSYREKKDNQHGRGHRNKHDD